MAQMVVTTGIDVSKEWLNIALWPLKAELQVDRTDVGYDQLATWLTKHGAMRVGLEASGGYESALIDALEARGFVVVRFNAQRVRLFPRQRAGWPRTIAPMRARLRKPPPCCLTRRRHRAGVISIRWSST